MPRRRPPRVFPERVTSAIESMIPGTLGGRVSSAAPVMSDAVAATVGGNAGVVDQASGATFYRDRYDLLADGAQAVDLTYLPVAYSEHVYLNGVEQDEGTDWTRTSQTISVLTAMGALTDDVLDVRYAYRFGAPVVPLDALDSYPAEVVADAPLFYYRMSGAGATELDLSGNGRNGAMAGNYLRNRDSLLPNDTDASTDFGNPSQGSTKAGSGFCTVDTPYDAGLITNDWSVELWSNKGSSAPTAVFQWDGRLRIVLSLTIDVLFYSDATTFASVATSDTGALSGSDYIGGSHHLVITYDSVADEVKFYRDGVQHGSTVTGVSTAMIPCTNPIQMGFHDGSDGLADGDEFAFYGTVLSATRVAAHYAAA